MGVVARQAVDVDMSVDVVEAWAQTTSGVRTWTRRKGRRRLGVVQRRAGKHEMGSVQCSVGVAATDEIQPPVIWKIAALV
jgi:hypothetical protein